MPAHYVFLLIAVAAEVAGTCLLKTTEQFSRPLPSLVVVLCYGVAFYCMSQVMRVLPVGITYAIWCGLGIILVAMISWWGYGQKLDFPAILGIGMILSGVVVIHAFSKAVTH